MENKLGYLGFLGTIGILGLLIHNFFCSLFLVFFFFFIYAKGMKNKLGYLGLLGTIGILGILIHSFFCSVFLVFFFFLTYAKVIPDELFKENVKKSALNAFTVNMMINAVIMVVCFSITNFYQFSTPNSSMLMFSVVAFVLNFIISILTFVFTLMIYGHKEKAGLE
ncbi:DUF3796 domain-containing protein [Clostridium sp. OS1-26]|uniref:DUF3796 domain-containing protein n=1 Tax=Clostridium sp. OS1-26 TaxID=3070681 RepID=UPI0027E0D71F|nr:DUF3796 domain-containing protein [Clostridium sp. OS1-26]WML32600.1 DUF3796 domain-containing protein [Clostridium sp. OS1-26]